MAQAPLSKNPWLRMSPLPRAIGVVCIVVGGVWVMQGIGLASGSVMSGNTLWAVIGAVVIVAGLIVLRRSMNAAKAAIAADPPPAPPTPSDGAESPSDQQ